MICLPVPGTAAIAIEDDDDDCVCTCCCSFTWYLVKSRYVLNNIISFFFFFFFFLSSSHYHQLQRLQFHPVFSTLQPLQLIHLVFKFEFIWSRFLLLSFCLINYSVDFFPHQTDFLVIDFFFLLWLVCRKLDQHLFLCWFSWQVEMARREMAQWTPWSKSSLIWTNQVWWGRWNSMQAINCDEHSKVNVRSTSCANLCAVGH